MLPVENLGFSKEKIDEYKSKMRALGQPFLLDDSDENTDEYTRFYFVGLYEGREVIYDTVMYTLRLQHESEMFEIAEHRAAKHFPDYRQIKYDEDENGNMRALDDQQEKIGLFMAEVILELEEEESVRVAEHVEVDDHVDFGIGLDVGLHVDKITPAEISSFITNFLNDTLTLDPSSYSFQTKGEGV